MPTIFRGMKADGEKPMLGNSSTTLGARFHDAANPNARIDITPDGNDRVGPGLGGMSVAPEVAHLPPHGIPKRLRSRYPKATANDTIRVWRHGIGPFINGAVSGKLVLRVDSLVHGLIEPSVEMTATEYQAAIHATQHDWVEVEPRANE